MSASPPPRDGSARPVSPSRLSSFEDEVEVGTLSMPPRRTASPAQSITRGQDSDPARGSATAEAPEAGGEGEETGAPVEARRAPRPSNAQIPLHLVEGIAKHCRAHRISHGELIIAALEANAERLADLVTPTPTVGGALFPTLSASKNRAHTEEQMVPLNFRLPPEHFAVLDQLVASVNAPSRSRLISAALTAYLQP